MDGPIIGYVAISDNPLMWPQTAIYTQFGSKKFVFGQFYKNYVISLGPGTYVI